MEQKYITSFFFPLVHTYIQIEKNIYIIKQHDVNLHKLTTCSKGETNENLMNPSGSSTITLNRC